MQLRWTPAIVEKEVTAPTKMYTLAHHTLYPYNHYQLKSRHGDILTVVTQTLSKLFLSIEQINKTNMILVSIQRHRLTETHKLL